MLRPALLLLCIVFSPRSYGQSPVDYRDVGLVVNDNDAVSVSIGQYFAQKRGVPAENVIHVQVPATETITDAEFLALRAQLEAYLTSSGLADSLNYLVLTKGVPLRVDRGGTLGDQNSRSASVDSELMLILGQWSSHIGEATLMASAFSARSHAYFKRNEHFRRKNIIPGGTTTYDLYLVTRLTGLTTEDVFALIDRSGPETPVNKDSALFVLDEDPTPIDLKYNLIIEQAVTGLQQGGWRLLFNRDSMYVMRQRNVLGYVSWGSNDDHSALFTEFGRPKNHWLPGSIAETYVSSSARSFTPEGEGGQSRIADLIAEGCTGASGYVFEPFSLAMTWVDVLFDRYTGGFNLAESFYMANPTMSWMAVIVGDPKTSIHQATTAATGPPALPLAPALGAAAPSPFRDATRISFRLPRATAITLAALDILGRQVAVLTEGMREAGEHSIVWNPSSQLLPGTYFLILRTGDGSAVLRVTRY